MGRTNGITSRRTPLAVLALAALMLAAPLAAAPPARAGTDRETAVGEESASITVTLPAGDYTWQATSLPAEPAPAVAVPFHFGFIAAISAPVTVVAESGDATLLQPGQAVAVEEGEALAVETDSPDPVDFSAIELVPVADSADPAAIAFPLTDGSYDLMLQRFTPPAGNAIEFSQLTQPVLVVVQAGSFTVAAGPAGGDSTTLAPGDATTLLFDSRLEQVGTDPTAFFIVGLEPSDEPATQPSASAPESPSPAASVRPSREPSRAPSVAPSREPSRKPSRSPSREPSRSPSPSSGQVTVSVAPSPSSSIPPKG